MISTLNGMRVMVNPLLEPAPKIRIPDSFEWCTDEFRVRHNAWLLERFGMNEDKAFVSDALGCVFVSPSMARKLSYA